MPRLSIIIPYRNDDQRLEETILSVLENRPRDCEVIVVHDGTYCDPYQLSDEIVYVQEEPESTVVELLNAGLMAACSPAVCTLLDGVVVSANWAERALERLATSDVAAVSPKLQIGRSTVTGISATSIKNAANLRSARVESKGETAAAPTLVAGFYRRRALLALDGWNEELGTGSADVELAMQMSDLAMQCECESQTAIDVSKVDLPTRRSATTINELAGIAAAHGIATHSFAVSVTSIIASVFTGTVATALAWSAGLKNATVMNEVADRIAFSRKQLGKQQDTVSFKMYSGATNHEHRKAA